MMYKSHTDLRDSFLSLHLLLVREQEENVAVIFPVFLGVLFRDHVILIKSVIHATVQH